MNNISKLIYDALDEQHLYVMKLERALERVADLLIDDPKNGVVYVTADGARMVSTEDVANAMLKEEL